jgi:general stress protein 26
MIDSIKNNLLTQDKKRKILAVFAANEFAVVSTYPVCTERAPESAVVALSYTEELCVFFGSFSTSRKNSNIRRDARVSVVVGWDNVKKQTVQIEGLAVVLQDEERRVAEERHCRKNADSCRFMGNLKQEYFKVSPAWIRYSDFSQDPQEVWEVIF